MQTTERVTMIQTMELSNIDFNTTVTSMLEKYIRGRLSAEESYLGKRN